jgi:hypothetical protein
LLSTKLILLFSDEKKQKSPDTYILAKNKLLPLTLTLSLKGRGKYEMLKQVRDD